MDKEQSIQSFLGGFSIPAFEENSVPDQQAFPYITYEGVTDSWGGAVSMSVSIWYRSTTWAGAIAKQQAIASAITSGGKMIEYTGGAMWLKRGTPFASRLGDASDDLIKRIALNIDIEYISEN